MDRYFTAQDAGTRYDLYRPKVHDVVLQWLEAAYPGKRYQRGLDVACGTGDSLQPLIKVCDEVIGIDTSDEMLAVAQNKNLPVKKDSYCNIGQFGTYNLISTCMAFHWFNYDLAVNAYKAASVKGTVWLIYNFSFGGHETSRVFNAWFNDSYLKEYPSPPRGKSTLVRPIQNEYLKLVQKEHGWIPVQFNRDSLVGYLSTQSNIEHAVESGGSLSEVLGVLLDEVSKIDIDGNFKYRYSYEIYEYTAYSK